MQPNRGPQEVQRLQARLAAAEKQLQTRQMEAVPGYAPTGGVQEQRLVVTARTGGDAQSSRTVEVRSGAGVVDGELRVSISRDVGGQASGAADPRQVSLAQQQQAAAQQQYAGGAPTERLTVRMTSDGQGGTQRQALYQAGGGAVDGRAAGGGFGGPAGPGVPYGMGAGGSAHSSHVANAHAPGRHHRQQGPYQGGQRIHQQQHQQRQNYAQQQQLMQQQQAYGGHVPAGPHGAQPRRKGPVAAGGAGGRGAAGAGRGRGQGGPVGAPAGGAGRGRGAAGAAPGGTPEARGAGRGRGGGAPAGSASGAGRGAAREPREQRQAWNAQDREAAQIVKYDVHILALNANVAMLREALSLSARKEVNATKEGGMYRSWTPLHCAAKGGSAEATQLLLEHGASTRRESSKGETALHIAAGKGSDEIVEILLDAGADPHATTAAGTSCAEVARQAGFEALAAKLESAPTVVRPGDADAEEEEEDEDEEELARPAQLVIGQSDSEHTLASNRPGTPEPLGGAGAESDGSLLSPTGTMEQLPTEGGDAEGEGEEEGQATEPSTPTFKFEVTAPLPPAQQLAPAGEPFAFMLPPPAPNKSAEDLPAALVAAPAVEGAVLMTDATPRPTSRKITAPKGRRGGGGGRAQEEEEEEEGEEEEDGGPTVEVAPPPTGMLAGFDASKFAQQFSTLGGLGGSAQAAPAASS